jgi:hypothetical protein
MDGWRTEMFIFGQVLPPRWTADSERGTTDFTDFTDSEKSA